MVDYIVGGLGILAIVMATAWWLWSGNEPTAPEPKGPAGPIEEDDSPEERSSSRDS